MEMAEGHRVETQHTHTADWGERREAGAAEQQGNGGY